MGQGRGVGVRGGLPVVWTMRCADRGLSLVLCSAASWLCDLDQVTSQPLRLSGFVCEILIILPFEGCCDD